jgi:hypothetical protein
MGGILRFLLKIKAVKEPMFHPTCTSVITSEKSSASKSGRIDSLVLSFIHSLKFLAASELCLK